MKKSLMFVLVLLCMASLVAGMAYSMVNVTTESTIALSAADDAILAFSVVEDADGTFTAEDNKIAMDFSSDNKSGLHGIQNNADYTWENNLKITNNSAEAVRVFVLDEERDGVLMEDQGVEMTIMNQEKEVYFVYANELGAKMPTKAHGYTDGAVLAAGESIDLTVHLRGTDVIKDQEGSLKLENMDIIFRAVPVE